MSVRTRLCDLVQKVLVCLPKAWPVPSMPPSEPEPPHWIDVKIHELEQFLDHLRSPSH